MKYLNSVIRFLQPIGQVLALAFSLLVLSWLTLADSTANSVPEPIVRPDRFSETCQVCLVTSNPLTDSFITAIPNNDGTIYFFAQRIALINSPVVLNIGPGGSRGSYGMTL